ncbi:MAG: DNA polymerase [Candidatus Pacearchaeota archaeon]
MIDKVPLKDKCEHLEAFLIGNPRQFLLQQGKHYCLRASCDTCPYTGKCEMSPEETFTGIIPSSRRGVGFEERAFLVLSLKPEISFLSVPQHLWNHPRDENSLDERNIHFILSDFRKPFVVIKGQFRFYGNKETFDTSEYSQYFTVCEEYTPGDHIVAFDYSAIEPRFSAIATQEPEWIKIYEGVPKVIVKEVIPPQSGENNSVVSIKGKKFCVLLGELDKVTFIDQCAKCKHPCKDVRDFKKNIPGDFHGLNALAFFSTKPDWPKKPIEEFQKADWDIFDVYRKIAKQCGLAAIYGAAARTLCEYMNCSEQEAQAALNAFFSKLKKAQESMLFTEQAVRAYGIVKNLFGRIRDVRRWSQSIEKELWKRKKDMGYAIRTGLNHPIQSTAADALKISMIRATDFIRKHNWSPYYSNMVPLFANFSYRDFICSMLLSIHDEEDFLIKTAQFDNVIPELYKTMQIHDIVKLLGVDFTLEMDVEYDKTRSFTAKIKYPSARIYLQNVIVPKIEEEPQHNALLLEMGDVTQQLMQEISNFSGEGKLFQVLLQKEPGKYLSLQKKLPEEFFVSNGVPYKRINMQ